MTAREIRRTLQSEFVRTLRKPFVDAVKEYGMVQAGDKIAVCISGGKDSMLLALICSSVIGIVFGFVPARNASLLNPIDALSRE